MDKVKLEIVLERNGMTHRNTIESDILPTIDEIRSIYADMLFSPLRHDMKAIRDAIGDYGESWFGTDGDVKYSAKKRDNKENID